jgi:HK97 gp10 family phage protein
VKANVEWMGEEVKRRAEQAIKTAVWEIGLEVEGQAVELAPIDLGRLKGSITTQMAERGSEVRAPAEAEDKIGKPGGALDAHVGTNVKYAEYQEYGTVRNRAQPYLRPALQIARGKAPEIVKNAGRFEFKEYIK